MDRLIFRSLIRKKPLMLDGATGTHLQENGLVPGTCPTTWVLEHPVILEKLQTAYYESGSDIVLAFSFGANRFKLGSSLLDHETVASINRRVADISLNVRDTCARRLDKQLYVAGDLSPTGRFLYPAGDLDLATLIEAYGEQVDGLLAAGVDLFIVETMLDLAQTRAAVIAVRERCDLPVIASLTIGESGRSLSGDLPLACLLSLQAVGADAFGFNCSFGPEKLADVLLPLLANAEIPLLIKPNAGIPSLVDGKTLFPLNPADFAAAMKPLASAGIRLLGGCCGTNPEHIRQLSSSVAECLVEPFVPTAPGRLICSTRKVLNLEDISQLAVIEVNNPSDLLDLALDAQDGDPDGLFLNCSQVDPDNHDALVTVLAELFLSVHLPLVFSAGSVLMMRILRQYPGRAGIIGPCPDSSIDAMVI